MPEMYRVDDRSFDGALLRQEMVNRGYTFESLCREAGVVRPTLRRALNGERVWDRSAYRIRRALSQRVPLDPAV